MKMDTEWKEKEQKKESNSRQTDGEKNEDARVYVFKFGLTVWNGVGESDFFKNYGQMKVDTKRNFWSKKDPWKWKNQLGKEEKDLKESLVQGKSRRKK